MVADAVSALEQRGHRAALAVDHVPARPGLYAIHTAGNIWELLGLGGPPDDRPLYVGKAEKSLRSRDMRVHFGTGRTGGSTVRRSLASRLHAELDLIACPRNTAKPERFANFGLEPDGDARLTRWMNDHLTLMTWTWPAPMDVALGDVETDVLRTFLPPLNIDKVDTPWRRELKASRAVLALQAEAWRPIP